MATTKKYDSVEGKYVIEKLGKGVPVLLCDLTGMRVMDCDTMTVGAINSFVPRTDCKWFTVTEVVDE